MLNTETRVGWQDYLAIVMRRRWFFVVPTIFIVAAATVWGMTLPRIYRAETIMMVEQQGVMNPLIRGLAVTTPVGMRLRILKEELLGWSSLSRLVRELKMDVRAQSPMAFENLIKRLQRSIHVRMRGGNLIVIAYEDQDPRKAQTLVNTITKIYVERNAESTSAEAGTAISFIESEMAVYKSKLETAERALREFKELYAMQMPVANQLNEQIIQLEVGLAQMLVENTELHPSVVDVKRRVTEIKKKRNEEIRRVLAQAIAKGSDPELYQDLLDTLGHPVTPADQTDPSILAAKEAYQAWVSRMDSAITPVPTASTSQIQIVTGSEGQGEGEPLQVVNASTPMLSLGPRQEQELQRLTRNYEVYNQTYRNLQGRLERAKVTQRLGDSDEGTKFKVLEPARLPLRPVSPNMLKIFIFSLFLGMFTGAGLAFIVEYLDQSFQSADDLKAALELPVIGSISKIITEADIEIRNRKRRGWITFKNQLILFKRWLIDPLWARIDRALVKAGL